MLPKFKDIFLVETTQNKMLNKVLWDNNSLKQDVLQGMNKIADSFIDFLKIDKKSIVDVIFTGSNCGYTYHVGSDIDIHILIDFEMICDSCKGMSIQDCFKAKKTLWNEQHDIKIKNYTVELYAGDKDDDIPTGAGVFSIRKNKWIQKPERIQISLDNNLVYKKAKDIEDRIDNLINSKSNNLDSLNKIKDKIKDMRKAGLEKAGEYAIENLAFKQIRDDGYLEKFMDYINNIEDMQLTIENQLTEGVAVTATNYGTNFPSFDNKKTEQINNRMYTFFKFNDMLYLCAIKNGTNELSFSAIKAPSSDEELKNGVFSDQRSGAGSALSVFGKVLYVILNLIKLSPMSRFWFRPADDKLFNVYTRILNSNITDYINKEYNINISKENNRIYLKKSIN